MKRTLSGKRPVIRSLFSLRMTRWRCLALFSERPYGAKNLGSLLLSLPRHSEQREESSIVVMLFLLPLLFFELDPSVALLPQDDERAVSCVILNDRRERRISAVCCYLLIVILSNAKNPVIKIHPFLTILP